MHVIAHIMRRGDSERCQHGEAWDGVHGLNRVCECEYLRRRQLLQRQVVQRFGEQFPAQNGAEVFGHDRLLLHRTVILQGEDQRVGGRLQGTAQLPFSVTTGSESKSGEEQGRRGSGVPSQPRE